LPGPEVLLKIVEIEEVESQEKGGNIYEVVFVVEPKVDKFEMKAVLKKKKANN
jgi:hypothetical protein